MSEGRAGIDRDAFDRDGFSVVRGALLPARIESYAGVIAAELDRRTDDVRRVPLPQRDTYDRAFLQATNLWVTTPAVRPLVMDTNLASTAAVLLGVDRVRVYHDQALFKESGGGPTPWHVDQYYWPLATDRVVTAWIPLQDTPRAMGPIEFATGSHRVDCARDLPIGDESERVFADRFEDRFVCDYSIGDVSFHGGWTCHRAGANTTDAERRVFCIIFVDADMRLAVPSNAAQRADRDAFCPGVSVGEVLDSDLNPIVG